MSLWIATVVGTRKQYDKEGEGLKWGRMDNQDWK